MNSLSESGRPPRRLDLRPWWLAFSVAMIIAFLSLGQVRAQETGKPGKAGKRAKTPQAEPPSEPPVAADPGAEPTAPADVPPTDPVAEEPPPAESPEDTPVEDEPPPSPISEEQVEAILEQTKSMLDSGKAAVARSLLDENPQAVATSTAIKALYVQAMVQSGLPVGLAGKNLAESLLPESPKHPWANFALGLYFTEGKKPDLKKALKHLGVAKSLKNPPSGVGTVYWTITIKSNLYAVIAGLGGVVFLIVAISKKRKKKKEETLVLNLEDLAPSDDLNLKEDKSQEASVGDTLPAKPAPVVQTPPVIKPKTDVKPTPKAEEMPLPTPLETPLTTPVIVAGRVVERSRKEAPKEEPIVEIDLMAAAAAADTAQLPPERSRLSPIPAELADRWEYLRKKAQTQAIPLAGESHGGNPVATTSQIETGQRQMRVEPEPPPSFEEPQKLNSSFENPAASCPVSAPPAPPAPHAPPEKMPAPFRAPPPPKANPGPFPPVSEEDGIVLDLSPERRHEDLLGKLKMLAIEDGELRTLMQQRNPSHLPALFEYVMTRPEAVRLAFVARELGHYCDPAVTDLLAQLLYHEDVRVVLAAIQGIQLNGDPSGILHVSPFIISPDAIVSEASRNALMSFGPAKILQMFVRELPGNPDDRIREAGVFVLSRMKGGAVTNLLVQMLADRSIEVRKKVVLGMTFQKDPGFLPVLREFMKVAPEEEKKLARKAVVFLQSLLPRYKGGATPN